MAPETPDWVRDAVFYLVFPDRFASSARVPKPAGLEPWDAPPTTHGFKGGDLLGVAERLGYLGDLGVNALYLTPVFASAANHRYHTYDYHRVDPILGGDAALRELLDAAHARGMRVVLDGVFNHTGRGFYPFHHLLENGAASPYLDWFHVDRARLARGRPVDAYPVPRPGRRSARPRGSLEALGYEAWWDLPALPKLNTSNPAVREYLLDVAERWIRFGIDGWRLDVPAEIDDDSFWRAFRDRVKGANPDAYLVGEIWHEAGRWLRGDQFDAVMNYLLTKALLGFFAAGTLETDLTRRVFSYRDVRPLDASAFGAEIERVMALYDPAVRDVQLNLLGSHDTPRYLTSAGGDRTALELAFLFLCTVPGAPCVTWGDEVGLTGGCDPDCRKAFPWDEARWDQGLHGAYRRAIALRRAHPALRRGSFEPLLAEGSVYAFARRLGGETVVAAFNAGREPASVTLPDLGPEPWVDALAGGGSEEAARPQLSLPGRSARVVARRSSPV